MADNTKIEWTDATWNPITGCAVVSPGCANCYAMRLAGTRLKHEPSRAGLTRPSKAGPVWTGETRLNAQWLDQPLRWRAPRRIFVCAHGDLFAESVPDAWIDRVIAVMPLAPQHSFQVLTKRAGRMRDYFTDADLGRRLSSAIDDIVPLRTGASIDAKIAVAGQHKTRPWPLPNIHLMTSAEDQPRADERIPHLLATPAAVRGVSLEPLLGPVDLTHLGRNHLGRNALTGFLGGPGRDSAMVMRDALPALDWVIVGGESGPGARELRVEWVRSIVRQCQAAGVACFVKQLGAKVIDRNDAGFDGCGDIAWNLEDEARVEHDPHGYVDEAQGADCRIHLRDRKGGDPAEWPKDLRVREFPR